MLFEKQRIKLQKASIRYIIFIYFTLTALAASIFIGISLYSRLSGQMSATIREENQILINQITRSMEDYLRTVMKRLIPCTTGWSRMRTWPAVPSEAR